MVDKQPRTLHDTIKFAQPAGMGITIALDQSPGFQDADRVLIIMRQAFDCRRKPAFDMFHFGVVPIQATPPAPQASQQVKGKKSTQRIRADAPAAIDPPVDAPHQCRPRHNEPAKPVWHHRNEFRRPGMHIFGYLHDMGIAGANLAIDPAGAGRPRLQIGDTDDVIITPGICQIFGRLCRKGKNLTSPAMFAIKRYKRLYPVQPCRPVSGILIIHNLAKPGLGKRARGVRNIGQPCRQRTPFAQQPFRPKRLQWRGGWRRRCSRDGITALGGTFKSRIKGCE